MPNPQAGGPPLSDRARLLIQCIRSYLPQPEDAPCCDDKGPTQHGTVTVPYSNLNGYRILCFTGQ